MRHSWLTLTAFAVLSCKPATQVQSPPGDQATGGEPVVAHAKTPAAPSIAPSRKVPAAGSFVPLSDDAYGAYKYAPEAPHVGEQAPAIEAVLANGEPFVLADALATQRVMILFYRGDW